MTNPAFYQDVIDKAVRHLRALNDPHEHARYRNEIMMDHRHRLEEIHGDDEQASYRIKKDLEAFSAAIDTELEKQEEENND
ncbi:MAG: hypothetical protein CMJ42_08300 [Phyllobacteriaceae bacterium]|nr:hypothetical protein [Phyllobacteriaceae bacterium]MBA89767.1 hypothetical protein [Phyllobacteriaceae bacterium]